MDHSIHFKPGLFILTILIVFGCTKNGLSQSGDTPSYIDVSSCTDFAQYVIRERKLPSRLIHLCESKQEDLDGEKFHIVQIEYGTAQDCPAGCFYDHFLGVVKDDQSFIVELPGPHASYIVSLLYSQSPFAQTNDRDYQCPASLESVSEVKLAKESRRIGWQIRLVRPYECSWFKVERTTVTHDNKFVHTGKVIRKTIEGSVFAYLDNNLVRWNFDKLIIKETEIREETRTDIIKK